MKRLIAGYVFVIQLVLSSCGWYDDRDLGNNFILWEDHQRYTLLYGDDSGGSHVIDYNKQVTDYGFDDRYIILKTKDFNNSDKTTLTEFWVVDKTKTAKIKMDDWLAITTGPLDSMALTKLLRQEGSKLTFNQKTKSPF